MMPVRNGDGKFRPGISGNPRGRPKKKDPPQRLPEDIRQAFFEVGEQRIMATGADGPVEMSKLTAVMMTTFHDALNGNASARRLVFKHASEMAAENGVATKTNLLLSRMVLELNDKVQELEARLPRPPQSGVAVRLPNGQLVKNSEYEPWMIESSSNEPGSNAEP